MLDWFFVAGSIVVKNPFNLPSEFKLNFVLILFLPFVVSGSSTSKPEEVKRLPGGKIKKKVRTFKDFSCYLEACKCLF